MKFRIIKKDDSYFLQREIMLFFWLTASKAGPFGNSPVMFSSPELAKEAAVIHCEKKKKLTEVVEEFEL